ESWTLPIPLARRGTTGHERARTPGRPPPAARYARAEPPVPRLRGGVGTQAPWPRLSAARRAQASHRSREPPRSDGNVEIVGGDVNAAPLVLWAGGPGRPTPARAPQAANSVAVSFAASVARCPVYSDTTARAVIHPVEDDVVGGQRHKHQVVVRIRRNRVRG